MSESQAVYLSEIPDELLRALREVLANGFGEIRIEVYQGKIRLIEKKETVKLRCKDSSDMIQ